MRIVKEGETRTLLCHNCGKTSATYRVRDVAFSDKRGTVKNILAAVCDRCDEVAAIPAQSTARIKEAFEQSSSPLEIRVPVHYLDILYVATQKIDTTLSESFNKALILWYLHALTSGRYPQQQLKTLLSSEIADAKASRRLSMKITQKQQAELNQLMQQQGMKKTSDVVKAVILKIHQDLVLEQDLSGLPELRNMAAAIA